VTACTSRNPSALFLLSLRSGHSRQQAPKKKKHLARVSISVAGRQFWPGARISLAMSVSVPSHHCPAINVLHHLLLAPEPIAEQFSAEHQRVIVLSRRLVAGQRRAIAPPPGRLAYSGDRAAGPSSSRLAMSDTTDY